MCAGSLKPHPVPCCAIRCRTIAVSSSRAWMVSGCASQSSGSGNVEPTEPHARSRDV